MAPAVLDAAPPVALLAHQGGWDEIGLVAIPLIIVAALLILANRRAKRVLATHQNSPTEPTDHREPPTVAGHTEGGSPDAAPPTM